MSDDERQRWNQRWGRLSVDDLPPPSPFLMGLDALLPRSGRALDVAGGAGHNAIWLARRGLTVTLADISDAALALAQAAATRAAVPLRTLLLDLEHDPVPPGPWDLVTCLFYIDRRLYPLFPALLAPGGLLAVGHPTRRNLERNPHPSARFLLDENELPDLLPTLDAIEHVEGWTDDGVHLARFVGRRAG